MLNVGHYLYHSFKKSSDKGIKMIERHFKRKDLSYIFPYYHQLKQALENTGLEYEITLSYSYKNLKYEEENYLFVFQKQPHVFKFEDFENDNYVHIFTPMVKVIIHYPEVKITNSKKNNVAIKDLFISTCFDLTGKIFKEDNSYIKGMKTTWETHHLKVGYMHSHISSFKNYVGLEPSQTAYVDEDKYLSFRHYCTGDGALPTIAVLIESEIKFGPKHTLAENLQNFYELWFRTVTNTVHWESLEGTPYFKMDNINRNDYYELKNIVQFISVVREYYRKVKSALINDLIYPKWELHFNEKGQIINEDVFHFIFQVFPNKIDNFLIKYQNYIDIKVNGAVVNNESVNALTNSLKYSVIPSKKDQFWFNGKRFKLTIQNTDINEKGTIEYEFKPHFKSAILQYFKAESRFWTEYFYRHVKNANQEASIAIPESNGDPESITF